MKVLLLPGMDGTGRLFGPLMEELPSWLEPQAVAYPGDRPRGYTELLDSIALPDEPFAIVAESFSGPLAVALAHRHPHQVLALVLAASFVRSPVRFTPRWSAALVLPQLFSRPPPAWVLRELLLGPKATDGEVQLLREVLASVAPEVLARRVQEMIRVDVSRELAALGQPLLYLQASRDRLVGPYNLAIIQQLHGNIQVASIDAPHLVLQKAPAAAAAAIGAFLGPSSSAALGRTVGVTGVYPAPS